jgi:hypothetical protein
MGAAGGQDLTAQDKAMRKCPEFTNWEEIAFIPLSAKMHYDAAHPWDWRT